MAFSDTKILLIGAGNMGGALLASWLKKGLRPQSITVIDTNIEHMKSLSVQGILVKPSMDRVTENPDCIVFAVKPQSLDELLLKVSSSRTVKNLSEPGPPTHTPLYLSIAAGKTLAYFTKHLGNVATVRAMPNTPAIIGKGISALCANDFVSPRQKELATELLAAAGETVWLDDEALMDAVTAISGSGPAYVFLFMEALIAAGKAQGLPADIAEKLVLHTLRGSVKLAKKSGEPLAQLRKNVTSPKGTTEAALNILMKDDALQSLVDEAVKAAVKRAGELAG